MSKVWKIIKYEYTRHVFKKRFLFGLLSLPVGILLLVGVAFLIASLTVNTTPIGYVDNSGKLDLHNQGSSKGRYLQPNH